MMSEMKASKVIFPPQTFISTLSPYYKPGNDKGDWLSAMPDNLIVDLRKYLLDHEDDIRLSIDDFGDLSSLFVAVFRREPIGWEEEDEG